MVHQRQDRGIRGSGDLTVWHPIALRYTGSLMNAPFIVDPETGRIRFPDISMELHPRMSQAEFISSSSSLNRDNLGANNGWQRYSIRELISDDRRLGLFLVFLDGQLKLFTFAYGAKDETWDNWLEEREAARLKEYQQELDRQLGDRNTFPWGKVSALVDSKSGGTEIYFNFS